MKKFFVLFMFVFVMAGCTSVKDRDSWKEDVLIASECGMDGLPCCVDSDALCQFGQSCCYDPNGGDITYCSETCDFGTENQFCRNEEPRCDGELVCFGLYCYEAGKQGQPCRIGGNKCDDNLVCYNGKCSQCGSPGEPCCLSEEECKIIDNQNSGRNECINNICTLCGASGNKACLSDPPCIKNNLFNNNLCYACGGENEPCCEKSDSYDGCNFESGLMCNLGFCEKILFDIK